MGGSRPIPIHMGCGFGACLGCVIPGIEKPFIVSCLEGPILSPEKVRW